MIEIKGQENIRQVGNLRNSAIFALRKRSDEADWNQFPQRHGGFWMNHRQPGPEHRRLNDFLIKHYKANFVQCGRFSCLRSVNLNIP